MARKPPVRCPDCEWYIGPTILKRSGGTCPMCDYKIEVAVTDPGRGTVDSFEGKKGD